MTKKPKDERATAIVMRATKDNPISILNINKAHDFARHCLAHNATDDDATSAVRKFIQQIEGYKVG